MLEKSGGAILTEEKDLSEGLIPDQVDKIFSVPGFAEQMGRNIASLSPSDANGMIFDEIVRLVAKEIR